MLTQHFVLGYFRQVPVGLISLTANEPVLIATSYFDGHGQAPDPVRPLGCERSTAFIEAIGLDQPQTSRHRTFFRAIRVVS